MRTFLKWIVEPKLMYFGSSTPSVSQPVVVSAAQQSESARQAQLAELKKQGLQSTILSNTSQASGATSSTGSKTVLGG